MRPSNPVTEAVAMVFSLVRRCFRLLFNYPVLPGQSWDLEGIGPVAVIDVGVGTEAGGPPFNKIMARARDGRLLRISMPVFYMSGKRLAPSSIEDFLELGRQQGAGDASE